MNKVAFTLAEVLIVLVVVGVIAAVVIPTLKQNIEERVNSSRHANIVNKVAQAMDTMKSLGLLETTYATTDNFVNALQKHLKIVKRCDKNHLTECWTTDTVTNSNGDVKNVSDYTTSKKLQLNFKDENENEIVTDTVGLVLGDGASIILAYNPAITVSATTSSAGGENSMKSLPVGFGKEEKFAYGNAAMAPIDFVMDVNGAKKPNSETIDGKYHDIRSFNIANFGTSGATPCNAGNGIIVEGIGCAVKMAGTYNWYQATTTACTYGSLPDKQTLLNIAAVCTKDEYKNYLPQSNYYWSSTEDITAPDFAWGIFFNNGDARYTGNKNEYAHVLCVEDNYN